MNKQADMWKKERDIWQDEDKRIQAKIKQINAETQDFLRQQEQAKQSKKTKKMDPTEKGFNKGLMREIKQKQRNMKEQNDKAESINDRM